MKKSLLMVSMSCLFVIGSMAYAQRDGDAPKEGKRDGKPEARERDGEKGERGPRDGEGARPRGPRDGDAEGRPRGPRDGEGRGRRPGPPPNPLMMALDTDKDGEISEKELSKAVAALKKLDKNDDGKLSGDEIHPPRPPRDGDRGRGEGARRPEGDRPPRDGDRPRREGDRPPREGDRPAREGDRE